MKTLRRVSEDEWRVTASVEIIINCMDKDNGALNSHIIELKVISFLVGILESTEDDVFMKLEMLPTVRLAYSRED